MIKKLRANFFTGVLLVIPLIVTFWFLYFVIDSLNLLFLEPMIKLIKPWIPSTFINIEFFIKILIIIFAFALLILIGATTRIILVKNIFGFGENILYKVPMINSIYRATKEIASAFFIQKSIFRKVVFVEYPRRGLYQVGFVTSDTKGQVQEKTKEKLVNVFLPTTPNPTSGMLVFVPENDLVALDMSVPEGMKMVISGGAFVPQQNKTNANSDPGRNIT